MSSKDKVASWRASLTEEERAKLRERDRENKAKQRVAMSDEQKDKIREKDRLRKAKTKSELKIMNDIERWQMRVDHDHLVNWQTQFDKIQ